MRDSNAEARPDVIHTSPLLTPGAVALLTTCGLHIPLRTRPVTLLASPTPGTLTVLTPSGSGKVAQVRQEPNVSLGGPTTDGWFSVEATATLTTDPRVLRVAAQSAGMTLPRPGTVALVIRPLRARRWRAQATYGPDNAAFNVPPAEVVGLLPR